MAGSPNQNPEQIARDAIDAQLRAAGWAIQAKDAIAFHAGEGQAVREYTTDTGPADYVLFVDGQPVGVIEAKKETLGQNITVVEDQTADYSAAKLKWVQSTGVLLPFLYEATGVLTRFTDQRDPKPRSREVFSFHRPETLRGWLAAGRSLRARLQDLPAIDSTGLRDCQIDAITHLDASLKAAKPRALVQMATGSGKTFTAITSIYRLLKHARVRRVLFLVDTRNLGEQAEQEFLAYTPTDDNRKFTELYTVARLTSSHVPADAEVCISTIQRMYSILQGRELDASAEDENPAERSDRRREPLPVAYSEKIPPEFFDLIIIDECHRSIYNLWRQVLDYFDAFLVGLTATPDARTYAFFKQNVVSEYTHEAAVADGVNVQGEIYTIETEVGAHGGKVLKGLVEKRENSPAPNAGSSRTRTRPTPPSSSTATSSTPRKSAPSSAPSAKSSPRFSPTEPTPPAPSRSPKPSSSPRPTPTPTTSSTSSARSSARETPSARKSPSYKGVKKITFAPGSDERGRSARLRDAARGNPSSPSSATATTRASPSPST
jgi:type I restriction enzyme R subunit